MIAVTEPTTYSTAIHCLKEHRSSIGTGFKGRFIQIFIGLKFFQNNIPSMFSGSFVTAEVLQSLLDDLYAKISRPPNEAVLSLFKAEYLARTGLVAPGNRGPQNTWRNNLRLQKGMICYAPVSDLTSPTFLSQDRNLCRHLVHATPGVLQGARCSLCPSAAEYRSESQPKWLRADSNGAGYAVTDLQQTTNFAPYVAPNNSRLPIFPLIIALYHDANPGLVIGNRDSVSISDFLADFNFSQAEYEVYFDGSDENPLNARIITMLDLSPEQLSEWSIVRSRSLTTTRTPTARKAVSRVPPASPVLSGTPTPPPAVNNGWEAEQFVASALQSSGWTVHDVSRQQLGYDIFAQRGRTIRYIEVKSSLGLCSPSLTAREWQMARSHTDSYVLAVVENFNPLDQNTVYWIPDPATCCRSNPQTSISHSIPRGSWTSAVVSIDFL